MAFPVEKMPEPGKAQQIALALGDKIPIDSMGYPIGKSVAETSKVVAKPFGISQREWQTAIEVATEYFRLTSGMVPIDKEAMISASSMPARVWNLIYKGENRDTWHAALAVRGIMKKGSGLTFDQLRALRVLTDVSMRGDLNLRLKKLGISWETYQNWMRDKKFKAQLDAITNDVVDQAQSSVMLELTRGAVEGNLSKIQYFHAMTGRAPKLESTSDVRAFLQGVIQVLQEELEDKELLYRIADRLQEIKNNTLGPG